MVGQSLNIKNLKVPLSRETSLNNVLPHGSGKGHKAYWEMP